MTYCSFIPHLSRKEQPRQCLSRNFTASRLADTTGPTPFSGVMLRKFCVIRPTPRTAHRFGLTICGITSNSASVSASIANGAIGTSVWDDAATLSNAAALFPSHKVQINAPAAAFRQVARRVHSGRSHWVRQRISDCWSVMSSSTPKLKSGWEKIE